MKQSITPPTNLSMPQAPEMRPVIRLTKGFGFSDNWRCRHYLTIESLNRLGFNYLGDDAKGYSILEIPEGWELHTPNAFSAVLTYKSLDILSVEYHPVKEPVLTFLWYMSDGYRFGYDMEYEIEFFPGLAPQEIVHRHFTRLANSIKDTTTSN